ncbi:polyprenyl synthetase family protein [Streptomyces minutiscleroticus]|uniref:polyprenyl synthetase family protein n=1 Tax=Streptomyces minutiscleroticus TaxID=68238 RepID=UPI003317EB17
MTSTVLADPLDPTAIQASVDAVLNRFLTAKARPHAGAHQRYMAALLQDFLVGGKRIRPLLCVTGFHAAGGQANTTEVIQLAASLELFQAFVLIHDDVMDASDTRRGRPSVHRVLDQEFRRMRTDCDDRTAQRFGTAGAILLGDLALTWSDELLHAAAVHGTRRTAVLDHLDRMRTEVMIGQYLDLRATGDKHTSVEDTLTVIRYKTAKYTVERPLQLGAALAGADTPVLEACSAIGIPLGEAFQLRDDLLGVFGDPAQTGKSCLDDLREGKSTTLLALALADADPAQAARLRALVGDPRLDLEGAEEVRDIFTATGARATVEQMITDRYRQALVALDAAPFTPAAAQALSALARQVVRRTS